MLWSYAKLVVFASTVMQNSMCNEALKIRAVWKVTFVNATAYCMQKGVDVLKCKYNG